MMKNTTSPRIGNEEPEIKKEGAPDHVNSFNPQECSSVQEGSGQSYTPKELKESGEVDTARKSRSTKEMDELYEGDAIEQVI